MEGAFVLLAVLACPVGMGLMMWFMSKGMKGGKAQPGPANPGSVDDLREEHARLGAELSRLEREDASPERVASEPSEARLAGSGS